MDRFPAPKPADAPAHEFSAYRARTILQELLAEGMPHPNRTPENKRVKQRIIARLDTLGLIVQEQRALGCNHVQPQCGFVENVLARIPGRKEGPAVLLMAHYDSVQTSMSAGDDGAGVATLLEVARILGSLLLNRST